MVRFSTDIGCMASPVAEFVMMTLELGPQWSLNLENVVSEKKMDAKL